MGSNFPNLNPNYFHHGENRPHQYIGGGCKKYFTCAPPAIELIYILEKHNTLTTINCLQGVWRENGCLFLAT